MSLLTSLLLGDLPITVKVVLGNECNILGKALTNTLDLSMVYLH